MYVEGLRPLVKRCTLLQAANRRRRARDWELHRRAIFTYAGNYCGWERGAEPFSWRSRLITSLLSDPRLQVRSGL